MKRNPATAELPHPSILEATPLRHIVPCSIQLCCQKGRRGRGRGEVVIQVLLAAPLLSHLFAEKMDSRLGLCNVVYCSALKSHFSLQERSRDEMYDRKVRKSRHRHGNHRGHRERKGVRSRSNEDGDRHRDRRSKHRHRERRERHEYHHPLDQTRHREREYTYEQRSRKGDRIRR